MQQQTNPAPASNPGSGDQPVQQIAENPNPRANENIRQAPFEEKGEGKPGDDVGTEITDGEAG